MDSGPDTNRVHAIGMDISGIDENGFVPVFVRAFRNGEGSCGQLAIAIGAHRDNANEAAVIATTARGDRAWGYTRLSPMALAVFRMSARCFGCVVVSLCRPLLWCCAIRYDKAGVSRVGIGLWGFGDPPGVHWNLD